MIDQSYDSLWKAEPRMKPATRARTILLASAALLGGCTTTTAHVDAPRPVVEVDEQPLWYSVASQEDIQRIERVDLAWQQALEEARSKGFVKAIENEGDLLDPAAGLPRAAPAPGPYRCRTIKLGTQNGRGDPFNAYKPFACYVEVENELLTIVKQTGSQRPAGRLYPEKADDRMIFLGTLALGTEEAPLPYGERADRDMAGIIQRTGPFRYRLVVPWPRVESKLDVIELVPVIENPQ